VVNIKFRTQESSNQNTRFLNAKDYTPPEAKMNHKLPPQTEPIKSSTNSTKDTNSPEVENPRFYQMSLDKSQDKHRPLKQQRKLNIYDLGTKATRARIIINDHKQNPLAIHNRENVDHKGNSSQNRARDQPTESHIYTRDEHHDGTTWVITNAL
jgi:hypothetical protein